MRRKGIGVIEDESTVEGGQSREEYKSLVEREVNGFSAAVCGGEVGKGRVSIIEADLGEHAAEMEESGNE